MSRNPVLHTGSGSVGYRITDETSQLTKGTTMSATVDTTILQQVETELVNTGWTKVWATTYYFTDEVGNNVQLSIDDDDLVLVEFEYALPGLVETLRLDAAPSLAARESYFGARRIVAVINALAVPDAE